MSRQLDPQIKVLKTKIHRATITHADLDYEGSLSICPQLIALSGLKQYEAVQVWNVTNGTRLETYAMIGQESGVICANGAAAHHIKPGDLVIIAAFQHIPESDADSHNPTLVFVDHNNIAKPTRNEVPGPQKPDN